MEQVLAGLAARLETIPGLLATHREVGASLEYPVALVMPPVINDFTEDFDEGSVTGEIDVVLMVDGTLAISQAKLFPFAERRGPQSVWQVIQADHTLGVDDSVHAYVRSFRPLGLQQMAGYNGYGGLFVVRATWDGSPS